jgi:hypothetical protein
MQNVITSQQIGNYTISTFYDECPTNPREWDNFGTMVFFHGRYKLGDKHSYRSSDYDNWNELKKHIIQAENAAILLPVYMYDHSGISLSVNTFGCNWDSGQIGFIYVSREKLLKEYYPAKIITKKLKERVIKYLIGEINEYNQYLSGEVYAVSVQDHEGEIVHECYGFYSEDDAINDAMQYVN